MRHIAFAAAAVALAALLLAGCGQGGEAVPGAAGSGEAAPGQTTQAADPPAADDSPLDLTGQEAAGHISFLLFISPVIPHPFAGEQVAQLAQSRAQECPKVGNQTQL